MANKKFDGFSDDAIDIIESIMIKDKNILK